VTDADDRASTSDEVLARRVQLGDAQALDELVGRYLRPVHAIIASFMHGAADVEDAVQDTFLRVLNNIASYDATRPFAPWLYEIARNVARSRINSRRRRDTDPLGDEQYRDPAATPDAAAESADVRRRVESALLRLPEQQRIAFTLHDVEGYNSADVAGIMGLSTGTVRSHLFYARRALRAQLADVLLEPPTVRQHAE
jgi:RNA polymerase sigma-70 factor, ECF subfamily